MGVGWTTAQTKDKRGMVDEREIPTIIRSLGVNPTQVRRRAAHAVYPLASSRTYDCLEGGVPLVACVHGGENRVDAKTLYAKRSASVG
jgi:hypothetical protein